MHVKQAFVSDTDDSSSKAVIGSLTCVAVEFEGIRGL